MVKIFFVVLVTLMSVRHLDCVPFCSIQTLDNVFNVGHLVHLTRCGEVWTYNPRMDGGEGGLTRDYSMYTYARRQFGLNMIQQHGSTPKRYLRFAAFSFQEVNCRYSEEDLHRKCGRAVEQWNGFTVIADNISAHSFRYDGSEFKPEPNSKNPLKLKTDEDMRSTNKNPNRFWPNMNQVENHKKEHPSHAHTVIHSALFDVDSSILYLVLRAKLDEGSDEKTRFCITYLNMDQMLHDFRQMPRVDTSKYKREDWAAGNCFDGNVIGIFKDKNYVMIAGRISYYESHHEDQLYTVAGAKNREAVVIDEQLKVENLRAGAREIYNLRTWFGCRGIYDDITPMQIGRKKRALPEEPQNNGQTIPLFPLFGFDYRLQINANSIQLFLSIVAIILVFTIIWLLFVIRSQSKRSKKNE